jgi:hypothetical protein
MWNYRCSKVGNYIYCLKWASHSIFHVGFCLQCDIAIRNPFSQSKSVKHSKFGFFFSSVSSVKMRGDCSFCWYWWNRWPSLFKLSFHKQFACCSQQTPTIFYMHLILRVFVLLTPFSGYIRKYINLFTKCLIYIINGFTVRLIVQLNH